MDESDVSGHELIPHIAWFIEEDEDQIEPTEQSSWQVDIGMRGDLFVISTINGVGCSQDGCPCVQSSRDACFGYRNRLLLHNFVDRSSVTFVHLIELVYAADSHIS